jgi:ABC-type multidrug transport system fused ATPase/permease subunit
LHKYEHYLDKPKEDLQKNAIVSGFFFGISQILNFIVFGLLFYIGTLFMKNSGVSLLDVFTAVYLIFFAGITIGNNSHFIPDIDEAKLAASHIFEILDSED